MIDTRNIADIGTYTSMQGLKSLHHAANTNPELAKKEAASQFESLLVQMLMKSMSDTNQALENNSENYAIENQQIHSDNALFERQLSLVVSHSDTGLTKIIEASLDRTEPLMHAAQDISSSVLPITRPERPATSVVDIKKEKGDSSTNFDSTSAFVKTLWSSAKEVASILGTDPKFLLAQAALETNWGKSILLMITGQSTHNLFNIKADSSWDSPVTQVNAIEYEDGLIVKNKSKFRAYESYTASFKDYVHFLKSNSRYQKALNLKNAVARLHHRSKLNDAFSISRGQKPFYPDCGIKIGG